MIRFLNENEWKALLGLGSDMKRHFHVQTNMNGRIELRAWPFFAQAAWSAPGIESKLVVEESVASTSVSSSCIGFISLAAQQNSFREKRRFNKSCMKHSCHLIERLKRKSWAAPPSRGSKHGLLYSLTSVSKGVSGSNAKPCVLPWNDTLLYFYSRKTPTSPSSTESNISWRGKTFHVMDKCQCGKVRRLSLQPIHLKCHAWNLSWCVIAALHPGHANAKQVEHSGTVTLRRLSIDVWFVIIVGQNILPWMLTTFKHVNPSGCNSVNAAGR